MEANKQKNRCLVLFPSPFQGHITPMLHTATLLHSKGFSITIIQTRHNSPDPNHFPHFTFHFIDDKLHHDLLNNPSDSMPIIRALNKNCLEPFTETLSRLLKEPNCVACLISDPMWDFAASVADSFNLPRLIVRTSSMLALFGYDFIPLLKEKGYYPLHESKLNDPLPDLPPLRLKDLPAEEFHELLISVVKETKTSNGVICNSFEELEGSTIMSKIPQTFPNPVFLIGPLHKFSSNCTTSLWKEDKTSISWLNKQAPKSVIYVSFGSVAAITETEFQEIAWGLANSMQPFLLVVRPSLILGSKDNVPWPTGYLDQVGERGHIVKWAPQEEVLAHPSVGGFWTHCGWNSTLESVCQGMPLICTPFFGDQTINSRNATDGWRIGLQVEKGETRENFERVIKRLMVEKEGEELRKRAADFKEKAKLCVMEGGSSYKSLERLTDYLMSL